MDTKKVIPIQPVDEMPDSSCSGSEPFALMVLDDLMEPEFLERDIIVCEPEGIARDGSFVVAQVDGEYYFRQLQILEGGWYLNALKAGLPTLKMSSPEDIKGVVILKKKPGRRKEQKFYV